MQLLPAWKAYFDDPSGTWLGNFLESLLLSISSSHHLSGLINSAQFLGNLIALPFTPYASDILGRRIALFLGSIVMCMGIALQAAAKNVPMFIGSRFCSEQKTFYL